MCVFMYFSITHNKVFANVILATYFSSKMELKGRQKKRCTRTSLCVIDKCIKTHFCRVFPFLVN